MEGPPPQPTQSSCDPPTSQNPKLFVAVLVLVLAFVELGLRPGPELGGLLAQLEEDRFAGEISTKEDALRRARELRAG